METKDLVDGESYLLRHGARYPLKNTNPAVRVKVIQVVRRARQAKVAHETGALAGLEEFVKSRELLCPWREQASFLRDERNLERLKANAEGVDEATYDAVAAVLQAGTGKEICSGSLDYWSLNPLDLQGLMWRAGLSGKPEDLDPLAWVDRHGTLWMPAAPMAEVAKALAAAEPDIVIHSIHAAEAELKAKGYDDPLYHKELAEARPGHALALRWAGLENEAAELRAEITRLRALVREAAKKMPEADGSRLLRQLDSPAPAVPTTCGWCGEDLSGRSHAECVQ